MKIGPDSMNKGSKEYLKHFAIGFALMCVGTGLSIFEVPVLPQICLFGSLGYVLLIFLGLMARIGPFAYIGKLYIKGAGIAEAPPKNRWPDA